MKTKAQKRNEAKKTAEALKAKKKMIRDARSNAGFSASTTGVKGKSSVPQSKKKK